MHSIYLNIVLQLIEGLVSFDFYESVKNNVHKWRNLTLILIGYTIMCAINLLFDYNVILNTIVLTLFQLSFSIFLYKFKLAFSLLYSILFTSLVTITELTVLEAIAIITGGSSRDFINDTASYIILIVLSKSLLFVFLKIISLIINKFRSNEKIHITSLIYPLSLLVVITVFGLVSYYGNPSNQLRLIIAFTAMGLTTAVIITCIIQQKQSQKDKELIELKAFQQEQEINTTYFELLEHQNDELQVFVHDTKKHYRTLYGLADNSIKLKEYIEGIVNDLEGVNQIGKTSNKLLDLIISKYNYICDKTGIVFEKNIHQSNLDFINDNDLTSIFNNLFDNAVEAAKTSQKKSIFFGLNKVGNMLVIDITNSCDVPPVVKNHKLISTKTDDGLHGYGFKSICRSVKKYNGDIEWEYKTDSQEFVVSIIFPIKHK